MAHSASTSVEITDISGSVSEELYSTFFSSMRHSIAKTMNEGSVGVVARTLVGSVYSDEMASFCPKYILTK